MLIAVYSPHIFLVTIQNTITMRLPKAYHVCYVLPVLIVLLQTSARAQHAANNNVAFKKTVITHDFVSEGAAVGDVNHDGKIDIMSGSFWFEAPTWTRHEIDDAKTFYPDTSYSNSFLNYSMDVDEDGWIDFVRVGFPGKETVWYKNPANKPGHWKMYMICENTGNESPSLVDVDGDGKLDFICNNPVTKEVVWYKSPAKGGTAWQKNVISSGDLATYVYTHGIGLGDINGDGRKDIMIAKGWWEAPVDRTQPNWNFHAVDISPECAQMYPVDLDGDGDNDVISSSAHDYGIWWHEQVKNTDGSIGFVHHKIDSSFSETHGLAYADVNADGNPDLVTGKRWYAHNGGDRGGKDPAVIYWYEYKPGKQPAWIAHAIDDNSGVGLHVVVQDMDKDGLADIVIGNKKGVFFFKQVKAK